MARSDLRIADLKRRAPATSRLINVATPTRLADAIATLATQLGSSKTEVIIALLNAGLKVAARRKRK
jgi:hypothetical protein